MRKQEKLELQKTVSMLIRANDAIAAGAAQHAGADIRANLSQCQEAAAILGQYLKTLGAISEPLISILKKYYETVYQMEMGCSDNNLCIELSKKVRELLLCLKDGITYHLPDGKKELVFFPYKASMWASLESVWMAASEDENYETYVVPIPYYDRNADGSFGKMHYEGGEFPDYVPVTSWEEYHLDIHRPDVAYIHNPYDNYNYVTSVHPMFYARNLKKYVNKLIYIPYFIAADNKVEKHFCTLPGVLYADHVIVQSETVKKTYIEELHKIEKENHCTDVFGKTEEKIIALGSPAYDQLTVSGYTYAELPEAWKQIVYRIDGTKKPMVLYNVSVQNILTYGRKMIDKIENSLRIFEAYQNDIALLWRPHPLVPATLQAMRPELWDQYRSAVLHYREAGWGIYDDSADMTRAVAASDAYYGDSGSLLALYEKSGKPIMLQRIL